jgi:hypothetical protein
MGVVRRAKKGVENGRRRHAESTKPRKGEAEREAVDPYDHLDTADELDDQERAKLHAALKHSWAQAEAGQRGCSLDEILRSSAEKQKMHQQNIFNLIASLPPGTRTKEEIDVQIAEERGSWGEP